jgi:hypothetical protein
MNDYDVCSIDWMNSGWTCDRTLNDVVGPVPRPPARSVALETTMPTANVAPRVGATASLLLCRQIPPLVAAALLAKRRSEMTTEQQNTVDALKKACPGYAVIPAW